MLGASTRARKTGSGGPGSNLRRIFTPRRFPKRKESEKQITDPAKTVKRNAKSETDMESQSSRN